MTSCESTKVESEQFSVVRFRNTGLSLRPLSGQTQPGIIQPCWSLEFSLSSLIAHPALPRLKEGSNWLIVFKLTAA